MVRTLKGGIAIALLLGFAAAAQAAGLGKLTVTSALGQPLNAEIDLVSIQQGEVEALNARVAPPEAYRDARIEYGGSLRLLRFSVEKRANGQSFVKVTSVGPINEPFLDVLIEVSWPQGRVLREYPILLDPPGYAQGNASPPAVAAPPPQTTARVESTPPAATPAATSSEPVTASDAPSGSPSASSEMPKTSGGEATQAGSDTYGPVQKGETLRKIAEQVKPSTVSMEQMLVSLYRQNQQAFSGNNMNRMKAGAILKVPTADEVGAIEQKEANKEIRTQVADWKSYRENLAGGVSTLPPRAESSSAASGKISTAAVTPPPPSSSGGSEVLKLSKSESGGKAGGSASKGGGDNQARVNALQEEVTAKDKALKESQSRVADLEKQIRDMQRLMDLKAGAPTKAPDTKTAAAPTKPEPAKPEPAKVEPVPPKADTKVAEAPKPTEPAKAPEPPKVAEAPKPAEPAKTEPKKEAPKTTDVKAAPKKAAPPPRDWMDDLADNWIYIAGGGLLLAGLIGGFLFVRRRKAGAEAGPSSAMTSAFPSDLKPEEGTGKAGGGLVDTGNSSFLTDFDKTGPGAIDTDEVDPIAEAEVYIAYGRDTQAEEILKEAMARDKNRPEVMLKLLEIYHARKSAPAFESVAKELHAAAGDSSPLWQKAAAMGAQIDPNNPLYAGASGGYTPDAPAAKPDVDFAADTSGGSAPAPDFNLDSGASASGPDLATESAPAMDFDIEATGTSRTPVAPIEAPPKEEKSSFDFDLSGLELPGGKKESAAPASSSSGGGLNLTDLSLDSGGGGGGEAVGTKLELAKAYLEIGDKDGARDILQEVAKEGSASQQEEAKRLISSL